jgi:phosphoribosylamine--glycine ligase
LADLSVETISMEKGGNSMKVLVIGGGGREHAVCMALAKSPKVDKLWCAPGNGGIAAIAECVDIKATDIEGVIAFSKANHPDLVVVTPDDPLALGMVDALEAEGIRAFGPRKNAAEIEGSKSFAKELMRTYEIPTAEYAVFDRSEEAISYIKKNGAPIVVKADGLALGKGVTVAMTEEEAISAVRDAIDGGRFGGAGARVVIEEFLTGPEVSVLAFVDGKNLSTMPSAQDHKRAFDNDRGPNTGGMGAFSPSRFYTEEIAAECMETIFKPTVAAMEQEGRPFSGVLYFGLMLTPRGPKVIEYNARFGDPETQAVLCRLDSDLFDIMNAVIDGKLDEMDIKWKEDAACCVVMASGGYPTAYEKGKEITGLDDVKESIVFHAGTAVKDGKIVTSGGRVLGVTAVAPTLDEAIRKAYDDVDKIHFDQAHFRHDIGIKKG